MAKRVSPEELEAKRVETLTQGPTKVIVINGRSKFWNEPRITYEQVVEHAYDKYPNERREGLHTVVYSFRGKGAGGSLTPGTAAPVEPGMVFTAVITDGA